VVYSEEFPDIKTAMNRELFSKVFEIEEIV